MTPESVPTFAVPVPVPSAVQYAIAVAATAATMIIATAVRFFITMLPQTA